MPGFLAEVLSKPHNRNYLTAVRTARDWRVPPRTMVFGDQPDHWSQEDVLLANALTVLDNEMCKHCGTPVWWGYSTDNTIQFKVESTRCYGCEALEKERAKQSKDKSQKHGESLYVEPYNVFDEPLPTRRELYERRRK